MSDRTIDRIHGCLIGSALGDAIGLYTEFLHPDECTRSYPSRDFSLVDPVTEPLLDEHRLQFESCSWTDDTDHTLLIVLSFLRNRKLIPKDVAKRLQFWCSQGLRCLNTLPLDIGNTIRNVVSSKSYIHAPHSAARAAWLQFGKHNAANGSLMRNAPVGIICLLKTERETFERAVDVGGISHADPRCAVSVAVASGIIRGLCLDEVKNVADIESVCERAWSYITCTHPEASCLHKPEFEKYINAQTLESLTLHDSGMGYVYKCLGSAIWCLREVMSQKRTFKEVMTELIMAGGDADTNGAVAGAFMGAYFGYDVLPTEWRDGLRNLAWYREKIKAVCIVAGMVDGVYDENSDTDTDLDGGKGVLSQDEIFKMEGVIRNNTRASIAAGRRIQSA